MIDYIFSGIWWIDALRLTGIGFLALLVLGFPAWTVLDSLRHRRRDAADMARYPTGSFR